MTEKRKITEEIEMAGRELVGFVEDLVRKGNARRIIIRNGKGKVLMEIPLTAGAAVGGVVALASPVLAALGALAALIAEVKVEIEREDEDVEAEVVGGGDE
jgi:hypothetical protein